MTGGWQYRREPFRVKLSSRTLFCVQLWMQVREVGLSEHVPEIADPTPPTDPLEPGSQGFLIRSLPVARAQSPIRRHAGYVSYVPSQYHRYYLDLRQSFADYKAKFSSKTRSTINRKIRKYAEHCGGAINWKVYRSVDEIIEFHRQARFVSAKTYQERLLDAGLPASAAFVRDMETGAREGRVRGYILFDRQRPVSYLYCPIVDGVLLGQYLGFDPEYAEWSVGMLLQWFALENMFEEGAFKLFDFAEGESEHKRRFSTASVRCADIFFLRASVRNILLARAHLWVSRLPGWGGELLDQLGLKARIKKLMRSAN